MREISDKRTADYKQKQLKNFLRQKVRGFRDNLCRDRRMAVDFTRFVHCNNFVKMRNMRGDGTDMKDNHEVMEIDLKRLVRVLWRQLWVVVIIAVLMAALAFSYAWFMVTPLYSSNVSFYVNNNQVKNPAYTTNQIAAAQNLANTYMVILESRSVLDEVIAQSGLPYTHNQLKYMISTSAVNETEIFRVDVVCGNSAHAALIANTIAEVLPDKIAEIVYGSSVCVVDPAVENKVQIFPNYQRYTILGAVLGAALAAVLIIAMDMMDTSIYSEEYLNVAYQDYPLLAVIPDAQQNVGPGHYKGYYEAEPKKQTSKKDGGEQ